jgi:hypothetical protein
MKKLFLLTLCTLTIAYNVEAMNQGRKVVRARRGTVITGTGPAGQIIDPTLPIITSPATSQSLIGREQDSDFKTLRTTAEPTVIPIDVKAAQSASKFKNLLLLEINDGIKNTAYNYALKINCNVMMEPTGWVLKYRDYKNPSLFCYVTYQGGKPLSVNADGVPMYLIAIDNYFSGLAKEYADQGLMLDYKKSGVLYPNTIAIYNAPYPLKTKAPAGAPMAGAPTGKKILYFKKGALEEYHQTMHATETTTMMTK